MGIIDRVHTEMKANWYQPHLIKLIILIFHNVISDDVTLVLSLKPYHTSAISLRSRSTPLGADRLSDSEYDNDLTCKFVLNKYKQKFTSK